MLNAYHDPLPHEGLAASPRAVRPDRPGCVNRPILVVDGDAFAHRAYPNAEVEPADRQSRAGGGRLSIVSKICEPVARSATARADRRLVEGAAEATGEGPSPDSDITPR